jgi:mono/diheme cytochrome c family protein
MKPSFRVHAATVFFTAAATVLIMTATRAQETSSSTSSTTTSSASGGVFSAEQAKRGQMLFNEKCVACHGDDLKGSGSAPGLVGDDFKGFVGRSVGDLASEIRQIMPADDPGTLTPPQAADLSAYILSRNNWPAGEKELPADTTLLKQIPIVDHN